jgi:hypothetical protein
MRARRFIDLWNAGRVGEALAVFEVGGDVLQRQWHYRG